MRMPILVSAITALACGPALADPRYELAVDPVSWLNHQYAASASVALAEHVVLRADAGLDTSNGTGADAAETAGASARLFLDRAFHGPFIEPGVVWRATPLYEACAEDPGDYCNAGHARATSMETLVGWEWTYASHYSLAGAAGMSRQLAGTLGLGPDGARLEAYVRAGYAW